MTFEEWFNRNYLDSVRSLPNKEEIWHIAKQAWRAGDEEKRRTGETVRVERQKRRLVARDRKIAGLKRQVDLLAERLIAALSQGGGA